MSKKNTQAVSIILWISIGAFSVASASMFIVLSVFSGLRELNLANLNSLNADLKIEAKTGKTLPKLNKVYNLLKNNPSVENISRVIEEKVYILNAEKDQVAQLIAVDENYKKIIPVPTFVIYGNYPDFITKNEMIVSNDLAYRVGVSLDENATSLIYLPKKGEGIIKTQEDAFVQQEIFCSGILGGNYSNTIITPIEFAEDLLESEVPLAYQLLIKSKPNINIDELQKKLTNLLGNEYVIKNRLQQDEAFIKMMNVEELMIYLIFLLIILVSSFNLAGAIIILIIDKDKQNQALISLGFTIKNLKKVYFLLGILISSFGTIFGLLLGSIIVFIQSQFEVIKTVDGVIAYPVKFEIYNLFLVFFTISLIGFLISWISSRKISYL